jgi:hypothetical protein
MIVSHATSEQTKLQIVIVNLFYDVIDVLPSSILSVFSRHVNLLNSNRLLVLFMFWLFL